jgi:hypothetical protein
VVLTCGGVLTVIDWPSLDTLVFPLIPRCIWHASGTSVLMLTAATGPFANRRVRSLDVSS